MVYFVKQYWYRYSKRLQRLTTDNFYFFVSADISNVQEYYLSLHFNKIFHLRVVYITSGHKSTFIFLFGLCDFEQSDHYRSVRNESIKICFIKLEQCSLQKQKLFRLNRKHRAKKRCMILRSSFWACFIKEK